MTDVMAPAPPRPPQDDPEALIEEARRRARRRRLAYGAAVALALGGVAVALVVVLRGNGSSATSVPPGFQWVKAKGRVAHLRVELSPTKISSIDLATGAAQPAVTTIEGWYDPKTYLFRDVLRIDGRVQIDLVGHAQCVVGKPFCIKPPYFSTLQGAPRWPLDPKLGREVGTGVFRGKRVVWVEPLLSGHRIPGGAVPERWGLDARTHRPIVSQDRALWPDGHIRLSVQTVFTPLGSLPARTVGFAVPEGGAPRGSVPPEPEEAVNSRAASLDAARTAVGRTALWLGPTFRGHRLRGIRIGTDGIRAKTGRTLLPARFVSFDYGVVELKEFGAARPFWALHGPAAGRLLFDNNARASLARGGLLAVMTPGTPGGSESISLDRTLALAVARALRPVS